MKRYLYVMVLMSGSPLLAQTRTSMFEDFDKDMKQMHEEFEKRFDAMEKFMATQFAADEQKAPDAPAKLEAKKPVQKTIEVVPAKDGEKHVIVKLHLGELEKDKIDIEAFEKTLTGSATLKDGSTINFYVHDGRVIGVNARREVKENKKDDKTVYDSWQLSESTKEEAIPAVRKLDQAEVAYENGVLQLTFERVPENKGTKLNVK